MNMQKWPRTQLPQFIQSDDVQTPLHCTRVYTCAANTDTQAQVHAHWLPFLVTLRLPCSDSVVSWLHSWKPMILRFTCHPSYPFTHIKHIQTTQKVAIHPPFHRQTGFTSGVCAKSLCSAQADKQASRDRKDGNVTPSAIFSCEELLPMHCDQGAHHKWTTRFKHFAILRDISKPCRFFCLKQNRLSPKGI